MKRYLTALVVLMAMMFAGNAMAFMPPPPPAHGWYVVDQANVLTPAQVNEINHRILAVSKVTKNELGVLILQTMDGASIDDVANATYRAWGVGKRGLDNGILLAISVGDRKWRIEVGKGVEGDVTDLQAADVGRNHLVPHLKQRPMDWYGGILETINTLDSLMESRINARVPVAAGVPRPLQYANTAPVNTVPTAIVAAPPVVVAPPVNVPVPVLAAPVVAASPTVSAPNATSNPDGIGVFLVVGLLVLLVVGGIFLYSSYRSSKEEEERQRKLQFIEAQNRRAKVAQEAAERATREQEAIRLRNQENLNRQATTTVSPSSSTIRHTVHHMDSHMTEKYVPKPSRPLDVPVRSRPVVVQAPPPRNTGAEDAVAFAALAAATAAAAREEERRERERDERRREQDEEERQRRARDEEDERRRRREQEEEDDRRRRDEESSRNSNDWSSPSSSNDDSSSWGGGDSGGSGFGGGDSGGGGVSGDF